MSVLVNRLPDLIWRCSGRSWLDSPTQNYALRHSQGLRELIGSPDSHLVRTGVVDPALLAKVFSHPLSVRRNAEALICSAMARGGPWDDVGRAVARRRAAADPGVAAVDPG